MAHRPASWKSQIKVPSRLGEGPLPGCRFLIVSLSSCGGRNKGLSFIRALIPFMRPVSSLPKHLPKALPAIIITFRA